MGCFHSRRVVDDSAEVEAVSTAVFLARGEVANYIPCGKELTGLRVRQTDQMVPCEMTREELVVENMRLMTLDKEHRSAIKSLESSVSLSKRDISVLKGELNRVNEELYETTRMKKHWENRADLKSRENSTLDQTVKRLQDDNKDKERRIKNLVNLVEDNSKSDKEFRRILYGQIDLEKGKVESLEVQNAALKLDNEVLRATRAERGFLTSLMPSDGQVAHESD